MGYLRVFHLFSSNFDKNLTIVLKKLLMAKGITNRNKGDIMYTTE